MRLVDWVAALIPQIRLNRELYYCPHCGYPVRIESVVRYPGQLIGQAPRRILARVCSDQEDCGLEDKQACPKEIYRFQLQPSLN
jgi:hypothetical protein